jgi:Holliday junction resolvase RusA-like endonuclease
MTVNYPIVPMGKPRQTQRDKWKKREVVTRYHTFKDECRLANVTLPEAGAHVTFVLPMPASWSRKKRDQMDGAPHTQKPDIDNCTKALMDAVFPDDSGVWDIRTTKIWGLEGQIRITVSK